ncbi:ribonuclease E/G, partial [Fusobacterium sp.]
ERKEVLKVLKENLKKDSEKTEVINYSSLNLVQLTRQRRGKELAAYYLEECPYCNGTGNIISEDRAILNLLKELTVISSDVDISGVEVIAKKEFSKKIKQEFSKYIEKIFEKRSVEIKFSENSSYLVNQYKINIWK